MPYSCLQVVLALSVSVVALISSEAVAQAPPMSATSPGGAGGSVAGDATALGEIIVTAQRRSQRLQDVPVAASVVSGQALERQDLKSLEAVSARLPDVQITTGALVDQINIRGVGSGQNAGFEQSVGTFVDGVYRSRSLSSRAALFDVDQVEVLKGPQTTFFGANAIAGALNITTRKPDLKYGYDVSALYAPSDGERDVTGAVNLPISDTLAIRVAGRVGGMDGYIHNTLLGDDGPRERTAQGRISVRWEPTSWLRSDLRFDGFRSRTDNIYAFALLNCPTAAPIVEAPSASCARYLAGGGSPHETLTYTSQAPQTFSNIDYSETAWTNSIKIGFGSINSITAYLRQKVDSETQPIPFPLPGSVGGTDGIPIYLGERFHQFSQELRYQSDIGGRFEYMFGGYFSKSRLYNYNYVGFFFLPFGAFNPLGTTNATTPVTGSPKLTESDQTLSAFASATIHLTESLRLNLGGRYSSIKKEAERDVEFGSSDGAAPNSFAPFDPITQVVFSHILGADLGQFPQPKRTDSKFMPSVGLQYNINSRIMAYATYTNGFKAGGYSAASLANEFGPETVNAYEAGLKGQFLDRSLTVNTAMFRSDYDNLQESTIVIGKAGTIISLVQNAARSRSQGVEFSADYRATAWITLRADAAYLDARYTSYPKGACTVLGNYLSSKCIQDLSGKKRPYAPSWSGNVGATIDIPVHDAYRVTLNPLIYFSSSFFESATADPLLTQPGFAKIDCQLGFGPEDGRWQLSVIGKNLANAETSGFRQQVVNSSAIYALPDRSRSVAIEIRFKR